MVKQAKRCLKRLTDKRVINRSLQKIERKTKFANSKIQPRAA